MKKILLSFTLLVSLLFICFVKTNAQASFNLEEKTVKSLGYGVTLDSIVGTSKSSYNEATQADGRGQKIYTVNVPKESNASVVVWGKNGCSNQWGLTSLEDIAYDYEATHKDKIVLAATNNWLEWTDDINRGELTTPLVHDGVNYRVSNKQGKPSPGTTNTEYSPAPKFLGFTKDGKNIIYTNTWSNSYSSEKLSLSFYEGGIISPINIYVDKINEEPNEGEIAIFFPNYTSEVNVNGALTYKMKATKIRYDRTENAKVFTERDAFALGAILNEEEHYLDNQVYYIVSKNETFNNIDITNKQVLAQYDLIGDMKDVYGGTAYYYQIVRDGKGYLDGFGSWSETNCEVHPRTVFVQKKDGSFALSVIDGRRQADGMTGMDYEDMANFYLTQYDALNAFNYDGGGSSCLVVRNDKGQFEIVNSPSDGSERGIANATLVVVDKDPYDIIQQDIYENQISFKLQNVTKDLTNVFLLYNNTKYYFNKTGDNLENATLTIEGLDFNNEYKFSVFYELDNVGFGGAPIYGNTCIRSAKLNKINYELNGNTLKFSLDVFNPDDAFFMGYIEVLDKNFKVTKLDKEYELEINDDITSLAFKVTLYSSANIKEKELIFNETITLKESMPEEDTKKGCVKANSASIFISCSLFVAILLLKKKH